MLGAELTANLGYEEGKDAPTDQYNRRNGKSAKVLKDHDGEILTAVPRDWDDSFEIELMKKRQTRIDRMDYNITGLYTAGPTVSEIQAQLLALYVLKASLDMISRATDAVLGDFREWQSHALDRMFPIVLFDALCVNIRDADSRTVKTKTAFVAISVTLYVQREVLGLWIAKNAESKLWLSVMNELKLWRVQDILIAVLDGLKGFPEAITAALTKSCLNERHYPAKIFVESSRLYFPVIARLTPVTIADTGEPSFSNCSAQ